MAPSSEAPQRRRPSVLVTVLLALVAIPALLFTACGVTFFIQGLTHGSVGLWATLLGLACMVAGGAALYALYRVFRGA